MVKLFLKRLAGSDVLVGLLHSSHFTDALRIVSPI